MANFDRSSITQAGLNLMGKAVGGATIKFTRLVMGDGILTRELNLEIQKLNVERQTLFNRLSKDTRKYLKEASDGGEPNRSASINPIDEKIVTDIEALDTQIEEISKQQLETVSSQILDLTGVISPRQNVDIRSIERNGAQCKVEGYVETSSIKQGFFWRECGLYAMDPDVGEILYNYAYSTKPDYIAASDSGLMEEILVSMVAMVGANANVDVTIDSSMVMTTKKEFDPVKEKVGFIGNIQVNVKEFGAVGDGVTDDTAAIQRALDSANSIYFEGGIYCTNALYIKSNTVLTFSPLAELKANPGYGVNESVLNISSKSNIEIIGNGASIRMLKDEYMGDSSQQRHCVKISSSKNITIKNLKLLRSGGDGVIVGGSNATLAENILIDGCTMDDNKRQGISLIGGLKSCIISNCTITNTNGTDPQLGIDLEPWEESLWNEDVLITNCYFENNKNGAITVFEQNRNITISNNRLKEQSINVKTNTGAQSSAIRSPKNIFIKNNYLDDGNIYIYNCESNILVEDNYINLSTRGSGITVENTIKTTSTIVIRENTILNAKAASIGVYNLDNAIIDNNTILDCELALSLVGSKNVVFKRNTIIGYNKMSTAKHVISLQTSTDIMVTDNVIKATTGSVSVANLITVAANCRNVIIKQNDFYGCLYEKVLTFNSYTGAEGIAYSNRTTELLENGINTYLPTADAQFAGIIVTKKDGEIMNPYQCVHNGTSYEWIKVTKPTTV